MSDGLQTCYTSLKRTFNVEGLRRSHAHIRRSYSGLSAKAAIFCSPAMSAEMEKLRDACAIARISATVFDANDLAIVGELVRTLPDLDLAIVLADATFARACNAVSQIHWAKLYNPSIRLTWLCRDALHDQADIAAYANLSLPWPLDHGTWEDVVDFLMLEVMEAKFGRRPGPVTPDSAPPVRSPRLT